MNLYIIVLLSFYSHLDWIVLSHGLRTYSNEVMKSDSQLLSSSLQHNGASKSKTNRKKWKSSASTPKDRYNQIPSSTEPNGCNISLIKELSAQNKTLSDKELKSLGNCTRDILDKTGGSEGEIIF